jgi:hypothetical protein
MLSRMMTGVAAGIAAGAAGTAALDAVTYADMALRGRPGSSAPSQAVERTAERLNVKVPGDDEQRENRVSALGAFTGIVTGLAVGAAYGAARALGFRPPVPVGGLITAVAAAAGANAPLAALGVTDLRTWRAADWASDAVPHLVYGLVTAASFEAMRPIG